MDNALNKSLIKATGEILQSMAGADVSCKPPIEKTIRDTTSETSVIITFVGSISGAITLKCSKKLASMIASQMLGMDVEEGSDDMKDAIGELLNMIVGTAKAHYSSDADPFKISIPTTIVGEDYTVHIKADPNDTISLLDFRCNGDTMGIEVYLQ